MATYWENSCSFGLRYVSWYKYLIVSLVFSHLGFWSGNLFLIAPFPDLCLLVPFSKVEYIAIKTVPDWKTSATILKSIHEHGRKHHAEQCWCHNTALLGHHSLLQRIQRTLYHFTHVPACHHEISAPQL